MFFFFGGGGWSIELGSFYFGIYFPHMTENYVNRCRKIYKFNIFERIRIVPRQSGGIYSGNIARIKTVNPQCDIVVHRLIYRDLKNNKAIKWKEMMNSSNYILVSGHIFIRYRIKIYSLLYIFLHGSG